MSSRWWPWGASVLLIGAIWLGVTFEPSASPQHALLVHQIPQPESPVVDLTPRTAPGSTSTSALASTPPHPSEHPHPITAQHQRIFRENSLIGALDGALDIRDAQGMERLLLTYRREYPDDPHRLTEGYTLLLECLRAPGAATERAAAEYFRERRGSILRRAILRHCLTPPHPTDRG